MKVLTHKEPGWEFTPSRDLEAEQRRLQREVEAHFQEQAGYWDELYRSGTVFGVIHQKRLTEVLKAVDELALPAESPVLEIGCGAGFVVTALAQRNYVVEAVDSAEAMIRLTRRRADSAGVGQRVFTRMGDIHRLDSPDQHFSLVLAIGVLPWLASPHAALKEMARVLRPNGRLIFTLDNLWRLNHALDPLESPICSPFRRATRRIFDRFGLSRAKRRIRRAVLPSQPVQTGQTTIAAHFHSLREVRRIVAMAGLEEVCLISLGFGPFSFLGRRILPNGLGVRLHLTLQGLADRGWPCFRFAGGQFLIVARHRSFTD